MDLLKICGGKGISNVCSVFLQNVLQKVEVGAEDLVVIGS